MSRDLIKHPTLRDLVVQHAGLNRNMCPDPEVFETHSWDDWMALAASASDERLIELRKIECRFTTLMVIMGQIGRWQEERRDVFETRNVYYTPAKAETELSHLLHTRRTEGRLRELMAADTAAAALRFRELAAEERLAPMREVAGPGPYDDGPLPTTATFEAMSDWELNGEWISLRMRTAFFEMYGNALDRKANDASDEMAGSNPAP